MFHQYFQMAHRIRKHYLAPRVLLCLLTGQFVPPINRKNLYSLQYSMLPARRASVWEMWAALTAEDTDAEEARRRKKAEGFRMPYIPPLANAGGRRYGNGRFR
jgi:phosphatidylinositol glycan class Q protein